MVVPNNHSVWSLKLLTALHNKLPFAGAASRVRGSPHWEKVMINRAVASLKLISLGLAATSLVVGPAAFAGEGEATRYARASCAGSNWSDQGWASYEDCFAWHFAQWPCNEGDDCA